jgi:peptidyl-prolyl cis-trans isomerase SurA
MKLKILSLTLISQMIFSDVDFIDRIAVIVDEGIIMESEVNIALDRAISNLKKNNAQIPPKEFLFERVIEGMIMDEILLQKGEQFGVRISDQELNETLNDIASAEGLTVKGFKEKLEKEGESFKAFRESVKNEYVKRRVQSGLVRPKIVISEQEIKNYIDSSEGENLISTEFKIDQILIKVPSSSDEKIIKEYESKAIQITNELKDGLSFREAIIKYSDLKDEDNFGGLYWKKRSEIPSLFEKEIVSMEKGEVSNPIKSGAGFHLIKLTDLRGDAIQIEKQSLVQHILIETSEIRSPKQAKDLINSLYERAKKEDLAILARVYSDDPGSKMDGGKLDWAPEGVYDKAFEKAMKESELNVISEPFESAFGWHILKVLERREKNITNDIVKDKAYGALFNRKFQEQLQNTLEEIRAEAFVDIKISSI